MEYIKKCLLQGDLDFPNVSGHIKDGVFQGFRIYFNGVLSEEFKAFEGTRNPHYMYPDNIIKHFIKVIDLGELIHDKTCKAHSIDDCIEWHGNTDLDPKAFMARINKAYKMLELIDLDTAFKILNLL